jgi:hypothetical protein
MVNGRAGVCGTAFFLGARRINPRVGTWRLGAGVWRRSLTDARMAAHFDINTCAAARALPKWLHQAAADR